MNSEVKLILKKLEIVSSLNEEGAYICDKKHSKLLLDYITNLQEENEFLKLNNPKMNMEHFRTIKENKRKIDNLRKENERLNDELKRLNDLLNSQAYQDLDNYKSKNEKAIEYIEQWRDNKTKRIDSRLKGTLNILQGSDK